MPSMPYGIQLARWSWHSVTGMVGLGKLELVIRSRDG